ncbi:MAG TPA: hypothetical protein VKX17_04865 [Planctomycetota bacterium]|nr:hypothetical protein [Planctomycetota bacterium]
MADNPLDPVIQWYQTALDSIRVTQRVVNQSIPNAITDKHGAIFNKVPQECVLKLDLAKEELERLVVLALSAIFERSLRDYLAQFARNALQTGDAHREMVRDEILKDIEFWNISSRVLELFPSVDPNLRGQIKQIIDYRNWVAHGHTLAKPEPSNVTPAGAHRHLTDFLVQAGVVAP